MPAGSRPDVLIVGAGLAGLVTARRLEAAGRRVLVVEARDRVGGRTWTHTTESGRTIDRGAETIGAGDASVLALCAELGVDLVERPAVVVHEDALVDLAGRPAPAGAVPGIAEADALFATGLEGLAACLTAAVDGGDDAEIDRLDAADLGSLVHAAASTVAARVWLGRRVRSWWMLPPEEISQLAVARQVCAGWSPVTAERWRVVGGADAIARRIADELQQRVRTGAPVRSLDHVTGRVVLADDETIEADDLVVTAPLPVLGRLWSDMPSALAHVSAGLGGTVSLELDRRLWLDYGRSGRVLSDRAWGEMVDASDVAPGDGGVLTARPTSHDGAALLALPDVGRRIVAEAERIVPGARGLVRSTLVTDWANDRWSLGTRAVFGPGCTRAAVAAMAQRHGRMWLAGEHTDARAGSMEGAVRSGERVGAALLS